MATSTSNQASDFVGQRSFRIFSLLLAAGVTVGLAAVVGRVAQLQLRPSPELLANVTARVSAKKELPLRGDITDRRGRLLAATRFSQRIIIDPTLLKDADTSISRIASATGLSADELGRKLIWAMQENVRRAAAIEAAKAAGKDPFAVEDSPEELEELVGPLTAVDGKFPTSKDDEGKGNALKKPIRYLALSEMLDESQIRRVQEMQKDPKKRVPGLVLESHPVREFVGGEHVAEIVGLYGWAGKHKTGTEKRLNEDLSGTPGRIAFFRDSSGNPLYVEVGQIQRAQPGLDVRLSIDLEIQRMAIDELTKGVEDADAQGGRIIVMDPNTGEVLAMADVYRKVSGLAPIPVLSKEQLAKRGAISAKKAELAGSRERYVLVKPDLDEQGKPLPSGLGRNRVVEDLYEPGSTFKPFVWSVITELGYLTPNTLVDTEGGGPWITPTGRAIRDVHAAGTQTWAEVLINSSNIGMIKGAKLLSRKEFSDSLVRFGFGKTTNIGLPGESQGAITTLDKWTVYSHTSIAYGNEIAVTPLQMVRAFSAFARTGDLAGTLPRLRIRAVDEGEPSGVVYRVLPKNVATLTRETLRQVCLNMESKHAKTAPDGSPWKYAMFGKSGTSRPPAPPFGYLQHQYIPSFIGSAPIENPQIVVLVVIDDPGPKRIASKTYYGAATAGPVVRKVVERTLTYLGAKPSQLNTIAKVDDNLAME